MLRLWATMLSIVYTLINFCFTDLFFKKNESCTWNWIIAIWISSYLSWELQSTAKVVYVQEIKLAKLLQWLNGLGWLGWWKTVIEKYPPLHTQKLILWKPLSTVSRFAGSDPVVNRTWALGLQSKIPPPSHGNIQKRVKKEEVGGRIGEGEWENVLRMKIIHWIMFNENEFYNSTKTNVVHPI